MVRRLQTTHKAPPWLEGGLLALFSVIIGFLFVAICDLLAPHWDLLSDEALVVLLIVALAAIAGLAVLVWMALVEPLRILDAELASLPVGVGRRQVVGRLSRRVRALYESYQRSRLALDDAGAGSQRESENLVLLGKLAAGVAHSIRNPLTGLKMRLFSLTRGLTLSERQQEHVDAISSAVAHMEKVITNFLEASRRPRLDKSRCRVSEVIDRVLMLLSPRIDAYHIRVERTRKGLPEIDADGEKLCEAFSCLISNACEAAGMEGFIEISEEVGRLGPMGEFLVVRIHDSGPGIPEGLREVVFRPFMSTKSEGTGLGLPLSRRIFEEHGGWINLHCIPGQGATFACVLPVSKEKDERAWLRSS